MKKIFLSLIPLLVLITLLYGEYTYKQYSDFYNNVTPLTNTSTTKTYLLSDVTAHASASSCFVIIDNNVYDLTSWVDKHPGGAKRILDLCGKDGTTTFKNKHGNDSKVAKILLSFQIGTLSK